MSVTPWGGLELSGITIAQTSAASPSHFLEARTFRLRVRFLSLFSRRLVIKEVSLVNPNIVWLQDPEGKWRLPGSREKQGPTVSGNQVPSISELPAAGEPPRQAASPATASTRPYLPSPPRATVDQFPKRQPRLAMAPEVQRVSIKGGNFNFLDRSGAMLASFRAWIFVPAYGAPRRFMVMQRSQKFRYGTAFFWSNCNLRFATNPMCWSFRKYPRARGAARSKAILPCNRKPRIPPSLRG